MAKRFWYGPQMGDSLGYVRTSTVEPEPHDQLAALTEAGCARVWADYQRPGGDGQPALAQALLLLRPGDEVVVWRLDRLARSLPQLVSVAAQIEAAGAFLRALEEGMSTAGAKGAGARALLVNLRDFQLAQGRESTRAGLDAARMRGRVGGRPPVMTAQLAEKARAALAEPGASVASVACDLGVSRTTLYRHQVHHRQAPAPPRAGVDAVPVAGEVGPAPTRRSPRLEHHAPTAARGGDEVAVPADAETKEER